jgi:hypothetical protein
LFGTAAEPKPAEDVLAQAREALPKVAFQKTHTFEGNRLYAYMNGAAEAYYSRNFRKLAAVDAKWKETQAKVELYRVETKANAAQLFDDFNDGQGKPLKAGERGTWWEAQELEGIFHRGPYFARVFIYGSDDEAKTLLRDLAAAIDQGIAQ